MVAVVVTEKGRVEDGQAGMNGMIVGLSAPGIELCFLIIWDEC